MIWDSDNEESGQRQRADERTGKKVDGRQDNVTNEGTFIEFRAVMKVLIMSKRVSDRLDLIKVTE